MRPCLDCGTPTPSGNRCPTHRLPARRKPPRPHYQGDYARRAAQVRATAGACWLCGEGPRPDDPWTADHIEPANPNSPLAPAHRSCNSRRGNRTPPTPTRQPSRQHNRPSIPPPPTTQEPTA